MMTVNTINPNAFDILFYKYLLSIYYKPDNVLEIRYQQDKEAP